MFQLKAYHWTRWKSSVQIPETKFHCCIFPKIENGCILFDIGYWNHIHTHIHANTVTSPQSRVASINFHLIFMELDQWMCVPDSLKFNLMPGMAAFSRIEPPHSTDTIPPCQAYVWPDVVISLDCVMQPMLPDRIDRWHTSLHKVSHLCVNQRFTCIFFSIQSCTLHPLLLLLLLLVLEVFQIMSNRLLCWVCDAHTRH